MKPALTPEEWGVVDGVDCADAIVVRTRDWSPLDPDATLPYHAIAALALRGQPFGFTREDVRILEAAWEAWSDNMDARLTLPSREDNDRMRSLISRIESLLPPAP